MRTSYGKTAMRRYGLVWLVFVGLSWLLAIGWVEQPALAAVQYTFFATPGGSGTSCTQTTPCSLTGVRDKVRTVNAAATGDIVVNLRGGTYNLTAPLVLNESDSVVGGLVIYQAYQNEVPVFSGGQNITGWTLYDSAKNIYRAPVSSTLETRQLYVNGVRAIRARSTGNTLSGATQTTTGYNTTQTQLASWSNQSDIELVFKRLWADARCPVSSIVLSGTTADVNMQDPCWFYVRNKGGSATSGSGDIWYLENAYELLDAEGEWYLNRSGTTRYLYYKPRPGENMASVTVTVPVAEELLRVEGSTLTNLAQKLQFKGITFNYATWLRPNSDSGHSSVQGNVIREKNQTPNEFTTDAAVVLKNAQNILFERCNFGKLGAAGLNMLPGTQDVSVIGNKFYDISGGGVQIGDPLQDASNSNPSDTRLILKNITVADNYIHDIGLEFRTAVGIFAAYPQYLNINHNEIANTPYSGLSVGWGWGKIDPTAASNNTIQYNHIHHVMQTLTDGGAIYTLGAQPNSVITRNYAHNQTNNYGAIYLDEGSGYYSVTYNVLQSVPKWLYIWTTSIHDNSADRNYATTTSYTNNGTNNTITANNPTTTTSSYYVPSASWNAEAQGIVDDAGLEPAYQDLLVDNPVASGTGLDENFDSMTTGAAPTGWDVVTTGGTVTVENVPSTTDKSVKIFKSGTTNDAKASKSFGPLSGTVTVETKVRADNTSGWKSAPYITDSAGTIAVSLIFQNGNIQLYDGTNFTTLQAFTTTTWYSLKIIFDTTTDKFDVYIDNVQKATQASARNPVTNLSKVSWSMGSGYSGTFYFDAVKVSIPAIIDDNFNAMTSGAAPTSWTTTTTGGTVTIENVPSTTDKSVKIFKSGTTNSALADKSFTSVSGIVTFEATVRVEDTSSWKMAPYISDSAGNIAVSLVFTQGALQIYDGTTQTTVQTVAAATWYNLKIVLNTDTDKFDLYVEGVQKASQVSFRAAVSSISSIRFGMGTGHAGTMYFDNVKLYQ